MKELKKKVQFFRTQSFGFITLYRLFSAILRNVLCHAQGID